MNGLNAFVLFGRDLFDGTVSAAVLMIMFVEMILLAADLIALAVLLILKYLNENKQETSYYAEAALDGATLRELILDTSAVRRLFAVGERFDYSGLVVNVQYGDGKQEELTESDYSVVKPSMSERGDVAVTVNYDDLSAEYTVSVKDKSEIWKPILGLDADITDVKTEYIKDEEFTTEGIKVYANYSYDPFREQITRTS